jgi:uncharacterized membrane protein YhaH (DUF805 family)
MQCPQCHNDTPADSKFCRTCGGFLLGNAADIFAPQRRVNFCIAIRLGFQNCFDFKGRSTRSEYWWWVLFAVLGNVLLTIVDTVVSTVGVQAWTGLLSNLFSLVIFVPGLALGARRLHDINRTGWWQLMWLAFFIFIPILILMCWAIRQGQEGLNRYGPDPRRSTF